MKNILFAVILFMGIHSLKQKTKPKFGDIKDDGVLVNVRASFFF